MQINIISELMSLKNLEINYDYGPVNLGPNEYKTKDALSY
jgi:hypothetical protein